MATKKLNTVFIVEDNAVQRSMLTDHLSKYPQLKVKEFSSGDACLKELISGNVAEPELVLMDYFLESSFGASKDGLETLSKLKEIYPEMDVIMLTSVENEKIVDLAKKKGALDYVVKSAGSFDKLDSILKNHFTM
ncbi:MAG: response regulator [Bacteroidetes bacterium]|nr:response regulator [Bacteroidota bacterium]